MPSRPAPVFSTRRRWQVPALVCGGLCLLLLRAVAFPNDWRADIPPKFIDPEVTAYAKALAQFRDHYVQAAMQDRHGDSAPLKKMEAEFPRIQAEAIRLLEHLQPAETKLFTEYIARCGQTMVDASMGIKHPLTSAH